MLGSNKHQITCINAPTYISGNVVVLADTSKVYSKSLYDPVIMPLSISALSSCTTVMWSNLSGNLLKVLRISSLWSLSDA